MVPEILVIDDEKEITTFFQYLLEEEKGYRVTVANTGDECMKAVHEQSFHLALVDLKLPDSDGISSLQYIKNYRPECQVIIMTGYSTVKSAVSAIKLGAFDYIEKPFEELEELESVIERALDKFNTGETENESKLNEFAKEFGIIMSQVSPLQNVLVLACKIAPKNITVLLTGETGTGKEVMARFIHLNSPRANKPFFAVNCGAFTESLLESELFGHEKGAFTGAHEARRGIFEIANGGTLFLDEIGEASPSIQLKLLRVLETGEFMRVGGETNKKTDARVMAATNIDLKEAVNEGTFREDLFYRLDVVNLNLPPLRERVNDIPLLAKYFIKKNKVLDGAEDEENIEFTPEAMNLLKAYAWPGNVRELANVAARAVALRESGTIGIECLPEKITGIKAGTLQVNNGEDNKNMESLVRWWGSLLPPLLKQKPEIDLNQLQNIMKETENEIIREVIDCFMKKEGGTYSEVAEKLGVNSRTLRYLKKEKK